MAASDMAMGGPATNTGSCAGAAATLRNRNSATEPRASLTVVTCPAGRMSEHILPPVKHRSKRLDACTRIFWDAQK